MTPVAFPQELVFPPPHAVMAQSMPQTMVGRGASDGDAPAPPSPLELKALPGQVKEVPKASEGPTFYIVYRVAPGFSSISIDYEASTRGNFLNVGG